MLLLPISKNTRLRYCLSKRLKHKNRVLYNSIFIILLLYTNSIITNFLNAEKASRTNFPVDNKTELVPEIDNVWRGSTGASSISLPKNSDDPQWIYDNSIDLIMSVRHYIKGDTILHSKHLKIIGREVSTYSFDGDDVTSVVTGTYSDYYYLHEDNRMFFSFYGEAPDTLYDFNLEIGGKWIFNYGGPISTLNSVEMTVVDTFSYFTSGNIFRGQVVQYNHGEGTNIYTDSVLNYVGSLNIFINPFDFFENNEPLAQGRQIRCFSSDSEESISFNTDDLWCYEVNCGSITSSTTGTPNSIGFDNLIVYPNPLINRMIIDNINGEPIQLYLLNALGEIVLKINPSSRHNAFDMSSLTPGVYFLAGTKNQFMKKFIKL